MLVLSIMGFKSRIDQNLEKLRICQGGSGELKVFRCYGRDEEK